MYDERNNSQLFDIAQGHVCRCHLIYYKQISSNDLLCDQDMVIFNFHHLIFDYPSMDIFLDDLNYAYTTGQLFTNDETDLRYLDCKYLTLLSISYYFSLLFRCYH